MIRVSRLGDYALVLMTAIARDAVAGRTSTARAVAAATKLPVPTVSKLLKALAKEGILTSQRGKSGGYALARPAGEISARQIIAAIEGPIAMTECLSGVPGSCDLQHGCPCRVNWNRINHAVLEALDTVRLDSMAPTSHGLSTSPSSADSAAADFKGASEVQK